MPSLRACRARPSDTWSSRGNGPCGGRVGDDAKGGSFGGAHSVRPRGKAVRKPRHLTQTACGGNCYMAYRGQRMCEKPRHSLLWPWGACPSAAMCAKKRRLRGRRPPRCKSSTTPGGKPVLLRPAGCHHGGSRWELEETMAMRNLRTKKRGGALAPLIPFSLSGGPHPPIRPL